MKKVSKLVSIAIAAVVALGVVLAPVAAIAKDSPTVGKVDLGIYRIVDVNKKTLRMTALTDKGLAAKKTITISKETKLDATYYPQFRNDEYTVIRICKNAFKGAKAKRISLPTSIEKIEKGAFNKQKAKKLTITIKSTKLTKKSSVRGMLKGAKAKKIVLRLPKAKKAAYKKVFTKKNLNYKGTLKIKWV